MASTVKSTVVLFLFTGVFLYWTIFHPSNTTNKLFLSWWGQDVSLDLPSGHVPKDEFLDNLISQMTVKELALQLNLMNADDLIGPKSDNSLFDQKLHLVPGGSLGLVHDWYPTNKSQYNTLAALAIKKSRLNIPLMQSGECLHGVGSFKQSMFPQSIGLSASFDTGLVHRVGRAIGKEASSIGIHACFSPVLDIGKDSRLGRIQEAWGEDFILTSHMGVAYSSGLSKNKTWSDPDAVVPVMKHFAAHGSPRGGINAASWMGRGFRQIFQEMLIAFKANFDLGGARGVMMAYSELDEIPCHIHPLLYETLDKWGYDGFVQGDDTGLQRVQNLHRATASAEDNIKTWFNMGGQIQYYDYPLDQWLNITDGLVANGSVTLKTLQARARRVLDVKYDVGLFDHPFIPKNVDIQELTEEHKPLTLESAHKSIVLLENKNETLPIIPKKHRIEKIALIGPFSDVFNFGDYSGGTFGSGPVENANTIRQAMIESLQETEDSDSKVEVVSSWGSNTWLYNGQYSIPPYHFIAKNGTHGGLLATYFANTNFTDPRFQEISTPRKDWGLYPPNSPEGFGLPSNNFSAIWEGEIIIPVDTVVDGFFGVAVSANATGKLFIDGKLLAQSNFSDSGNIFPALVDLNFVEEHGRDPPPGSSSFVFKPGSKHRIRVEFQFFNLFQKVQNENNLNCRVELFWNLVDQKDPVRLAEHVARTSDLIVLAVGAAWNSDGESGDRATLGLSANQTRLADAMFGLGKPVVIVLEGGRPFAITRYYDQAAAVINAFFPGQNGGRAITDVLFGRFNPGGRIPLSVPCQSSTLPVFYNYKPADHILPYLDVCTFPQYSFGYGLSYSTFSTSYFQASTSSGGTTFTAGSTIKFSVNVNNTGPVAGSYVPQVYLLGRVSIIVRPILQLVAFSRVYLEAGEDTNVTMELEVDRFLPILNAKYEWELETGNYTFALLENSAAAVDDDESVTLTCVKY